MKTPEIKTLTMLDWALESIGLSGIVLTILLVVISYSALPDSIPRHFNLMGQVDGFGQKSILFFLPAITTVVYSILTIGLRFPQIINYPIEITAENAERQHKNVTLMVRIFKTVISIGFSYLTFATIQIGLGKMQGLGIWFIPIFLLTTIGTNGLFIYRGFKLR